MKQLDAITEFFDLKIRDLQKEIAESNERVESLQQEIVNTMARVAERESDLAKAHAWRAEAVSTMAAEEEEEDSESGNLSLRRRVELHVEGLSGEIFTPKDVIDGLNATGLRFREGAVHTILQRLETNRVIEKMARGSYRLARSQNPNIGDEQPTLGDLPNAGNTISENTTAGAE